MVTVVFTVYSDIPFWLDVSRIELLLALVAVSPEFVEAAVAAILLTEFKALDNPASRSIYVVDLGESLLLGAGLSKSMSSLTTNGSLYY